MTLLRIFTLVMLTGFSWLLVFNEVNPDNVISTFLFSLFLSVVLSLVRFNQQK